jgi:hypothetical protein
VAAKVDVPEAAQNCAFMQALFAEFSMLQGARGATISESTSRSSLYMTTLSASVVARPGRPRTRERRALVSIGAGAAGALALAVAFLLHQWSIFMKVEVALPMAAPCTPVRK